MVIVPLKWIFISLNPLTQFETRKYYQNELRFNGVYSRDDLTKIKDEAYIINLDAYSDTGTHWVTLCVHNCDITYLFLG